jgi:O-antigen ligase/polysaccharide polymerase Wzy-like membrane protein
MSTAMAQTRRAQSGAAFVALGPALAMLAGLALAVVTVEGSGNYRLIFALAIGGNLLVLARISPRAAILAGFAFLPFLGLVRRLLIDPSGWDTHDPLLLVMPALAIYLCWRLFVVGHRPLARDRMSQLVLALAILAVLSVLNPFSPNSLLANTGGLLFVLVPLLWFFIGREICDQRLAGRLIGLTIVLAMGIAVYGLLQQEVGFPSWDDSWIEVNGFSALNVGGSIRSFGTLTSSAEYALYLSAAAMFAVALFTHGRLLPILAVPLLAVAVFMQGSRSIVVLGVLALIALTALRTRDRRLALPVAVLGVALAFAAVKVATPLLESAESKSDDPFVVHQLGGLTDPLDPESSTAKLKFEQLKEGVASGFRQPLGVGPAAVTRAADRFSGSTFAKSSELDVSDAFIGYGLVGGVLFAALVVTGLHRVTTLYFWWRHPAVFGLAGVLIVSLGQWWNGGYYALSALLWLLLGWATAEYERRRRALA